MRVTQGAWSNEGIGGIGKTTDLWKLNLPSLSLSFSSVRWKAGATDRKGSYWLCDSMTPLCSEN